MLRVAVVDDHHAVRLGLQAAIRAEPGLAVAGADAIVHKGGHTRGLLDTIRLVARGGKAMPAVPPGLLEAVGALLDEQDLPVLALLLEGTEPAVIAEALALVPDELAGRIDGMLQRLHVPVALGTG